MALTRVAIGDKWRSKNVSAIATVKQVNPRTKEIYVAFEGFTSIWNGWISLAFLKANYEPCLRFTEN
jgi:hypothetical protein